MTVELRYISSLKLSTLPSRLASRIDVDERTSLIILESAILEKTVDDAASCSTLLSTCLYQLQRLVELLVLVDDISHLSEPLFVGLPLKLLLGCSLLELLQLLPHLPHGRGLR